MGKFDLYKVPLKSLAAGTHEYEYKLDNQFFRNIDEADVQKGDVKVLLSVKRTGDTFEMNFEIDGVIQVACDRCLDSMDLPVSTKEKLYVKFGAEYSEESEDVVIIPEAEGEINLAWFLYEFIALTIPLKHVHQPGKCNKTVSAKLRKHTARRDDDEEDDDVTVADEGEEDDFFVEEDLNETNEATDPRWDELKKIIDNN